MKLTLIGRPGKIVEEDTVMVTTMQSTTPYKLPQGLPAPPAEPMTYLILIKMKQWRRVRDSIQNNPDDKLIIEGYPVFDKRVGQEGMLTVYAQNVTSIQTQRAQRDAARAKSRRR